MAPPDSDVRPVFVYGTLRPGRANWAVVAPWCRRHEPAILPGFGLYALDHPVVAPLDDRTGTGTGSGVRGDLLWLDPAAAEHALARLDAFEGVARGDAPVSYYRRASHLVHRVAGDAPESVEAWVYVPGDALAARIEPGRRVPGDDWPA